MKTKFSTFGEKPKEAYEQMVLKDLYKLCYEGFRQMYIVLQFDVPWHLSTNYFKVFVYPVTIQDYPKSFNDFKNL